MIGVREESGGRGARLRRALGLAVALGVLGACGTLTVEEEKALGRREQRAIRQQFQLIRDPVTLKYIRDLGQELAVSSAPSPFEFRFYVIEDEELNAVALPGGAIYVFSGLIMESRDASELAGVIAHEIGHVTARHVAENYRRSRTTGFVAQFFALLINIAAGRQGPGELVGDIAARAYMTTFTREAEREADRLGIETLLRAGYHPEGMATFFETVQGKRTGGFRMPQFLVTHPAPAERIANAREYIASQAPLPEGLRTSDGGRLEIIQERLRLIIGTDIEDYLDEEDEEDEEEDEELEKDLEVEPDDE